MQFSMIFAAAAALAAGVSASYNGTVVYTTEVHTQYTTVCPAATTLTYNGKTITATASETITLPCPCTIVKPITTTSAVVCTTSAAYQNGTVTTKAVTTKAVTTAVGTTSKAAATTSPSSFTGAANKMAASGASLAGLLGLAAFVL